MPKSTVASQPCASIAGCSPLLFAGSAGVVSSELQAQREGLATQTRFRIAGCRPAGLGQQRLTCRDPRNGPTVGAATNRVSEFEVLMTKYTFDGAIRPVVDRRFVSRFECMDLVAANALRKRVVLAPEAGLLL